LNKKRFLLVCLLPVAAFVIFAFWSDIRLAWWQVTFNDRAALHTAGGWIHIFAYRLKKAFSF
jgi:hypothetical protein